MNDIKTDTRNRLGDILLDFMLIAMYSDEHEFDYCTKNSVNMLPLKFGTTKRHEQRLIP